MDTEKMIKRIQLFSLSCDLKTEEGVRHFHCGHEYVEIGGVKWATMNVGAKLITDYGQYFQWGDTQGYIVDQIGYGEGEKAFMWEDYKWTHNSGFTFTKYNETDGKTVLGLEDDAVRYHWGGNWRIPTKDEFQALIDATINIWTSITVDNVTVKGRMFRDKVDSSKVLFFPAAGYAFNGNIYNVGGGGYVLGSSLNSDYVNSVWNLAFRNGEPSWYYYYLRFYGFSVRGVVG